LTPGKIAGFVLGSIPEAILFGVALFLLAKESNAKAEGDGNRTK
jgi:hypothetical protein